MFLSRPAIYAGLTAIALAAAAGAAARQQADRHLASDDRLLQITHVDGAFVIRERASAVQVDPALQLGSSIHLDSTLFTPAFSLRTQVRP